jgi:hypothetical protein
MRKPKVIPLRLPAPELEVLHAELEDYQTMGVVGDAEPHEVLSSVLTLKKPGGGLRWVIPCFESNEISVIIYWMAPDNAEELQSRMQGAVYFFLADMYKGFWQVLLHEDSQWLFCFATPWGPKKWLRAPMGSKVTAPYFDYCKAKSLEGADLLRKGIEMIHDDDAGHADEIYNEDPASRCHFHLLRRYLKWACENRIRLSPKKFELFLTQADIGGYMSERGGMRPSPPRYQSIVEQQRAVWLDQVYGTMTAIGWYRPFIPNFAVKEHPVRVFVMGVLGAGKKSMQRAKKFKLSECGWNAQLDAAFDRMRLSVVTAMKRAYRNYEWVSCLIWDASKYAWSYTITQVHPSQTKLPWDEQKHQMLVTRSGIFHHSMKDRPINDKEAFPPWRAVKKDGHHLRGKKPYMMAGITLT